MVGDVADEVVLWEVNHQRNLMSAIFSQVVNHHVQELRKTMCRGCEVDHPSQRRHDCIILVNEDMILSTKKDGSLTDSKP